MSKLTPTPMLALIVHADAKLRTLSCDALQASGDAVDEAEDGREAWRRRSTVVRRSSLPVPSSPS
jgi:CheY-like chemotaxis protein